MLRKREKGLKPNLVNNVYTFDPRMLFFKLKKQTNLWIHEGSMHKALSMNYVLRSVEKQKYTYEWFHAMVFEPLSARVGRKKRLRPEWLADGNGSQWEKYIMTAWMFLFSNFSITLLTGKVNCLFCFQIVQSASLLNQLLFMYLTCSMILILKTMISLFVHVCSYWERGDSVIVLHCWKQNCH